MGSNQSTHKYTIVNEKDDNIIKISNDVAQRLSKIETETNNNSKLSFSNDEMTTFSPAMKTHTNQEGDIYYPYYTISALEVHQEKQKELENQEVYWKKRLNNLKKNHELVDDKLINEYNKTKMIFDDYKVKKIKEATDMCKKYEENLVKCYADNQYKVLNCSEYLSQYSDCVTAHQEKCMPF